MTNNLNRRGCLAITALVGLVGCAGPAPIMPPVPKPAQFWAGANTLAIGAAKLAADGFTIVTSSEAVIVGQRERGAALSGVDVICEYAANSLLASGRKTVQTITVSRLRAVADSSLYQISTVVRTSNGPQPVLTRPDSDAECVSNWAAERRVIATMTAR